MDLDDHGYPPAGECSTGKRCGAEKGIGREDRLWLEAPDLAPQPQRQPEIEEEAVEPARPRGARKPEAIVARAAVLGRRPDHAVVELSLHRIPFLREPRREREAVARASDEQNAGPLGHLTASDRSASSLP